MWDALQVYAQTPSATETTEKLALKTDEDAGVAKAPPPQGWVGTYHAAGGNVQDGKNTSAFDVGEGQRERETAFGSGRSSSACWATGSWGIVSPVDGPSDGGFSFREAIGKIVMLSRFVALAVSLTRKISLLQSSIARRRISTSLLEC